MYHLLKRLKRAIVPMFYRVPVATIIEDHLYQASVDLLNANLAAEHWNAECSCLRQRVARLLASTDKETDAK